MLSDRIIKTLQSVRRDINLSNVNLNGSFPGLVETGFARGLSDLNSTTTPASTAFTSISPEATILIKKKAFSSFAGANDIRFFDRTERMLLRATKALFAYKVQQLRAFEALTKFDTYYTQTSTYSFNLLTSLLRQSKYLINNKKAFSTQFLDKLSYRSADEYAAAKINQWLLLPIDASQEAIFDQAKVVENGFLKAKGSVRTNLEYINSLSATTAKAIITKKTEEFKAIWSSESDSGTFNSDSYFSDLSDFLLYGSDDYSQKTAEILELIKRNAFAADTNLTTWIVDPTSVDNYLTGPGTGVIELTLFTDFRTSNSLNPNPESASFMLEYPYGIGIITEDDIDIALEEAMRGTLGLLSDLMTGSFKNDAGVTKPSPDGLSILGAASYLNSPQIIDGTIDVNYLLQSMRSCYLGKSLVNAADGVHFFIRGNRFRQKFNYGNFIIDDSEYTLSNSVLRAEYELYTNKAINFDEYKAIRKESDNSFGMIQQFSGFIESVSESYGSGATTLSVNCTNNLGWLKWSQIPREPALSDVTSILEDPLTPYKLSIDRSLSLNPDDIELLDENKQLLDSKLLSFSNGLLAGKNANLNNILQGQYNGIGSLNGSRILQHPDGFVYRWKTGILTATAKFLTSGPRSATELMQYTQYYSPTAVKNPINNLDIANIISTLITGEPYNILKFIELTAKTGVKTSRYSATLNPQDQLTGYIDSIKKQNKIYGNFKPYRLFTQNTYTLEMLNLQGSVQKLNAEVKALTERKSKLNERLISLVKSGYRENSAIVLTLKTEVASINEVLATKLSSAYQKTFELNEAEKLNTVASINTLFGQGDNAQFFYGSSKEEHQEIVRAISKVASYRRIEDVRLNRDSNLLIISDQYDTSDIRPFILGLNSSQFKKFDGEYENLFELCTSAARYVHMEFYCNSQGHIVLRPPQWNKTPLSLLKALIKYKKITGKDVIPDFIINAFETRRRAIYTEIFYAGLKIAAIALLLGRFPDSSLIPGMRFASTVEVLDDNSKSIRTRALQFFGISFTSGESPETGLRSREFNFDVTSNLRNASQNLERGIFLNAITADSDNYLTADTDTMLGAFDTILITAQTIEDIQNQTLGYGDPIAKTVATPENLNKIRDAFKKITGRDIAVNIAKDSEFTEKDFVFNLNKADNDNYLEITGRAEYLLKELEQNISIRDSYIRLLRSNKEREKELESAIGILTNSDEQIVQESGTQNVTTFSSFLMRAQEGLERVGDTIQSALDLVKGDLYKSSAFDYLIEDDETNDLGYGSGKRFIISDDQIISATFNEKPPAFTRVDIIGNTPLNLTANLESATDGRLLWAGATDFDMWRQYGYKVVSKNIPFITDPETMGKPYAVLELLMESADINSASITIIGNEFYQPGDVVYIPSKNLIYYVHSVAQSFSYGSSFSTALSLKWGRPPGKYLPNPMDILGQQVLGSEVTPTLTYRSSRSDDNYRALEPESSIKIPPKVFSGESSKPIIDILSYSNNNLRFTTMMAQLSNGLLAGDKYLLLRGFVKSEEDAESIAEVYKGISALRGLFQNPVQAVNSTENLLLDDLVGQKYKLEQMRLPNSRIATPIPADKIIEQISYLDKEAGESVGQIKCVDPKLLAYLNGTVIGDLSKDDLLIFPKDGPRQTTWLDFRDELVENVAAFRYVNTIEVGIITIPKRD